MVEAMAAATIPANVSWDEERWSQFVRLIDEAGRFAFGFPPHFSSESDIFGALDDIASALAETQIAVNQTTALAERAVRELREALEPLLPDEDEPPEPATPGSAAAPAPGQPDSEPAPLPREPVSEPVAVPSPVVEPASRVGRVSGSPVAAQASVIDPVVPTAQDEEFFAAIRRLGNDAAYGKVADATGQLHEATIRNRLVLLAGYGTMPDDIAAYMAYRSTRRGKGAMPDRDKIAKALDAQEELVREVAADIKARDAQTIARAAADIDAFADRRRSEASKRAGLAWFQRTVERPA